MGISVGSPVFVGRDTELNLLGAAALRLRTGAGGAYFVLGEAGIGKSRLATEVATRHGGAGGRVVRGRAGAAPLRAVSEAVLAATRLAAIDPDRLGGFGPVLSRLVGTSHPALPDPPLVRAEALLRLLTLSGRPGGCLLILDDLHEADADTLAIVDYLVDNVAGEPVLVVGTLRPDPGPALDLVKAATTRRAAAGLELRPLDRRESTVLAALCLGGGTVSDEVAEQVVRDADGIPFVIEELVAAMVDEGRLVREPAGWRVDGGPRTGVPVPVATALLHRVARLGPGVTQFLQAAAVLGRTFGLPAAAATAGVAPTEALRCLRLAADARLVEPGEGFGPDGYAFRHALTVAAMLAPLLPTDRARLCAAAARAVGPGGGELTAELWAAAGEPARAAQCLVRVGREAVDRGTVAAATVLLERGLVLADQAGTAEGTADALEALTTALAMAGDTERVWALGDRLDTLLSTLEAPAARRVAVRLVRARAAAAEGSWERGLAEVAAARTLAADEPDEVCRATLAAPIDGVAAFLCFGSTRPDRIVTARRYATAAFSAAQRASLPAVACEALEVLVRCARHNDLPAAAGHAQRLLDLARRHDLPAWRLRASVEAATIEKERSNDIGALLAVRHEARDAGVVITVAWIDFHLAVAHLLRGDSDEAQRCVDRTVEAGNRLRQPELQLVGIGCAAAIAAGRPDRGEMERLLGPLSTQDVFAHGAETWWYLRGVCSWLEEEPERALKELGEADAASRAAGHLRGTGHRSLYLLVRVANDTAGWAEYDQLAGSGLGEFAIHRGFLAWSRAILHGRDGRRGDADVAVAEAFAAGARTALNHHLAARVAAPLAVAQGWGDPLTWLRDAEEFFHDSGRARAAAACRALLRGVGAGRQRRVGHDTVPVELRRVGVTVREYEVLLLVAERLGNTEIGERLFLSPRTVERHVASLRQRTGAPGRPDLVAYARQFVRR